MSATFSLDRWHPLAEEWEPGDVPLPEHRGGAGGGARRGARRRTRPTRPPPATPSGRCGSTCPSHREAVALAEQLEARGVPASRAAGSTCSSAPPTEDDANELAERLRAEAPQGAELTVEPSGEMAWEAAPKRSKWFFIVPNM